MVDGKHENLPIGELEAFKRGLELQAEADGVTVQISVKDNHDGTVDVSWTVSRTAVSAPSASVLREAATAAVGAAIGAAAAGPVGAAVGAAVAVAASAIAPPGPRVNFDAPEIPAGRKDIAALIVAAFAREGFGVVQQAAALANAIAESRLDPEAENITAREASFGLFQLNTKGGLGTGHAPEKLKDADFNIAVIAKEAKRVAAFGAAQLVDDAVEVFVRKIERPADQDEAVRKRAEIARALLA